VADAAWDVAELAGTLGLGRFSVLGHSGGAPHALACAALLPSRVRRAAALASPAPPDARDLSWFDGMADSHVEEFTRALTDPFDFAGRLAARAAGIRREPAQLLVSLRDGLTDSDRRIVSDPAVGEMLLRTYREALRGSSYGWLDDDPALLSDWGFDPAAVIRPVLLWHGAQDGSPRSATSHGWRTASPASAPSSSRTPAISERWRPCLPYWTGSAHHRTGPCHDRSEPPYGSSCVRGSTGCRL
jgi:pimeloyl-ACP methyl ester carboxylesterase